MYERIHAVFTEQTSMPAQQKTTQDIHLFLLDLPSVCLHFPGTGISRFPPPYPPLARTIRHI
jgi:hypothetical protein